MFCTECAVEQYCKRLAALVYSDEEIRSHLFQSDFRLFLARYSFREGILFSEWHDHLCGLYRDYHGCIKGRDGSEVYLDLGVFEHEHIREWFRDFIQIVPPGVRPRLRGETKERVRVFATIMRAHFPEEGMMWGIRAANDN